MGVRTKVAFTSKRNVLKLNHHLYGCITVESEFWMISLYSNNAAAETDWT